MSARLRSRPTRKTGPGAATGGTRGTTTAARRADDQGEEEEDPPTDGRQLLGWAAKQVPDAKGRVIAVGKKRGYPSRILDWTPQQVAAAYRAARGPGPRVAVIHTGGGHFLTIPSPMPRALEARGGLRHSDLADAGGGRSECPGRLYRGRQHPSERAVRICANWRCRACGASIALDRATGAVRLDTSRPETVRGLMR